MMMMDDSALTNERKKFVKTYKNVRLQKRTVVAVVCGETYSKKVIKIDQKNGHRRNYLAN